MDCYAIEAALFLTEIIWSILMQLEERNHLDFCKVHICMMNDDVLSMCLKTEMFKLHHENDR